MAKVSGTIVTLYVARGSKKQFRKSAIHAQTSSWAPSSETCWKRKFAVDGSIGCGEFTQGEELQTIQVAEKSCFCVAGAVLDRLGDVCGACSCRGRKRSLLQKVCGAKGFQHVRRFWLKIPGVR